jgi:uroporphyrinogen-III synthase
MAGMQSALQGKRIVLTRAAHQLDDLEELLRGRGAVPLPYPCIAIAPPEDPAALDAALADLLAGAFDWLVLTSQNAVLVLADRLKPEPPVPPNFGGPGGRLPVEPPVPPNFGGPGGRLPVEPPVPPNFGGPGGQGAGWNEGRFAVAAIGAATAEAAGRLLGLSVQLVPDEFVAEALAEALAGRLSVGGRVLICQADIGRPVLAEALRARGIAVTSVVAYRTVIGRGGVDLPALLADRQVDAITFTSPSTVRNLFARLAAEGGDPDHLADVCVACLGPVTADAARRHGLSVHVLPEQHTIPALVEALEAYFAGENR